MSCGLPSVVSAIPGNCQLVQDQVHGLQSKLKDDASIGSCLQQLFQDSALRARMGMAARGCIVDNYSTARVVERYQELFAEVTQ
jgi:glycosyltransferase involved in cell wall biosynthesis